MRFLICLAILAVVGCSRQPAAPALRDEPAFESKAGGFRMLMPDGWSTYARSNDPAGTIAKESAIIQYRRRTENGMGATFEVTLLDVAESADLEPLMAVPAFGVSKWTLTAPVETIEVDHQPAKRFNFSGVAAKTPYVRESVAVRRGGRLVSFHAMYAPNDSESRDQTRRAVASVIWTK